MNPRGPEVRRVVVDCTLTLEVGVQYHPLGPTEIVAADVDWTKLRIGLAYWQPQERTSNIGVNAEVLRHLRRHLPRQLEVRLHRDPPKKRGS